MQLAILGNYGSGKTTAAKNIEAILNYAGKKIQLASFASALREELLKLPCITQSDFANPKSELIRNMLNSYGAHAKLKKGNSYWVDKTLCELNLDAPFVIDDLRFMQEAEALVKAVPGVNFLQLGTPDQFEMPDIIAKYAGERIIICKERPHIVWLELLTASYFV